MPTSYTKSQLARLAGVSLSTFHRWLQADALYLRSQGVSPYAKLFPPQVVRYLADKYAIDLPR